MRRATLRGAGQTAVDRPLPLPLLPAQHRIRLRHLRRLQAGSGSHHQGRTPELRVLAPGVARSFCGTCGTPIAYAAERYPGEIHLYVSTLGRPEAFEPGAHVHVGEQLPWLHLDDGLPRFQTTGYASNPLP